jgi:hypothetical protein
VGDVYQGKVIRMFLLTWIGGDSDGFTDHIRKDWFNETGPVRVLSHYVIGPDGQVYEAQCQVSVSDESADLDYGVPVAINRRRGMTIGVLRLHFDGPDRRKIARVEWKEAGGDFGPAAATIAER